MGSISSLDGQNDSEFVEGSSISASALHSQGEDIMGGLLLMAILSMVGQAEATNAVPAMPKPPLAITRPPEPSKMFRDTDLSTIDGAQLAGPALRLSQQGKNREAAQMQYWAIKATDDGRYNLACFLALAGEKEAAFYWLQQAAITDGADGTWAGEDSDLAILRKDPRWAIVAAFLKACNVAWSDSGYHRTTLILPKGYKRGTRIGVVVGLHGLSSDPGSFVDEDVQPFADELNMAFVGVSGTIPGGRSSFSWAEKAAKDAPQIRRALKEVAGRVTIDPRRIVLYGFSQGGMAAFEVAFANPTEFRGAIPISPGGRNFPDFAELKTTQDHKSQGYICLCGGEEAAGNLLITRQFAAAARKAGARVELIIEPKQSTHSFPADFAETFAKRVRFIVGEK
jgi:predicted esterase